MTEGLHVHVQKHTTCCIVKHEYYILSIAHFPTRLGENVALKKHTCNAVRRKILTKSCVRTCIFMLGSLASVAILCVASRAPIASWGAEKSTNPYFLPLHEKQWIRFCNHSKTFVRKSHVIEPHVLLFLLHIKTIF